MSKITYNKRHLYSYDFIAQKLIVYNSSGNVVKRHSTDTIEPLPVPIKVDIICERLLTGQTLKEVLNSKIKGMPSTIQFRAWINANPEMRMKLQQARLDSINAIAEEMVELAKTAKGGEGEFEELNKRIKTITKVYSDLKDAYADEVQHVTEVIIKKF